MKTLLLAFVLVPTAMNADKQSASSGETAYAVSTAQSPVMVLQSPGCANDYFKIKAMDDGIAKRKLMGELLATRCVLLMPKGVYAVLYLEQYPVVVSSTKRGLVKARQVEMVRAPDLTSKMFGREYESSLDANISTSAWLIDGELTTLPESVVQELAQRIECDREPLTSSPCPDQKSKDISSQR